MSYNCSKNDGWDSTVGRDTGPGERYCFIGLLNLKPYTGVLVEKNIPNNINVSEMLIYISTLFYIV